MRLDQYLVKNSLFESREKARQAIEAGQIFVNDKKQTKSSHKTLDDSVIEVKTTKFYVSRAAQKLEAALNHFNVSAKNKFCLDIGSSTGGFTQILLEQGAEHIDSVDVGSEQLHPSLRANPKIQLHENTDIRSFEAKRKFDLITIDVSFISLRKIIPLLKNLAQKNTIILALFKPQFEVGKEHLKKGICRHPNLQEVIDDFEHFLQTQDIALQKTLTVPLKGKQGNQEYFLLLSFRAY